MANNTFLQIPNNLDDVVVLRRVLTDIVKQIDVLIGARGDGKAATESQVITSANNLEQLSKDVNSLDNKFVHRDGDTNITAALAYTSSFSLVGNSLVTATHVTEATKEFKPLVVVTAPAELVDPNNTVAKVNEIITALKSTKLMD